MFINDQKLLFRLKRLGLQKGSGSLHDYETAKKILRGQNLPPTDYENQIKQITDYLKCNL